MATVTSNEQSTTATGELMSRRPRPVFFWSNGEVMKWLKRCCEQYYELYGDKFLDNEITGRSLIRIQEDTLKRMGVENPVHRDEMARIILKLKLKSDMIEIKDLERKMHHQQQSQEHGSSTNINHQYVTTDR
ncbi:sterile alpha motif domain-containing protein aveugle [Dermatophagoides farinae]|uniref:Protein aveugle-like protein n=1 Tax=Dermatophagoides farinae TaxID=6954 RepID=A0A9D4SK68_DERFA|nr:protein aveugle-like [Dermatophagoides farinae]KAH7644828.1 protein aveugle-like protein [Dermatophagoides farinae]